MCWQCHGKKEVHVSEEWIKEKGGSGSASVSTSIGVSVTISVRISTYSTYLLKSDSIIIILRSDVQLRADNRKFKKIIRKRMVSEKIRSGR